MKPKIAVLALCLALNLPAYALTPVWGNRSAGEYQGKEYVIEIDRDIIMALPAWKPGDAEPKIASSAAWKLARAKIKSLIPQIDEYRTTRISLERVGSNDDVRYIYQVEFVDYHSASRVVEGRTYPNCLSVWISTDGKVFGPRPKRSEHDDYMF